jgi:hypothetical protein
MKARDQMEDLGTDRTILLQLNAVKKVTNI